MTTLDQLFEVWAPLNIVTLSDAQPLVDYIQARGDVFVTAENIAHLHQRVPVSTTATFLLDTLADVHGWRVRRVVGGLLISTTPTVQHIKIGVAHRDSRGGSPGHRVRPRRRLGWED